MLIFLQHPHLQSIKEQVCHQLILCINLIPCMSETGCESKQAVILGVLFITIFVPLAAWPAHAEMFDVPLQNLSDFWLFIKLNSGEGGKEKEWQIF